jgi:DNA-binding NtrC family response regulator
MLRVLQDREVRPVGGTQSLRVDVRIVAATNKDLRAEMDAGRFRRDLFYRLNVIPIHIPPLRDRPEDIPALAEFFLRKHGRSSRRVLSRAAMEYMLRQPWEGNARELENAIERAVALTDAPEIGPDDLPLAREEGFLREGEGTSGGGLVRDAVQRRLSLHALGEIYIEEILKLVRGNKVQAARILGINRRTLYRRGERAASDLKAPRAPERASARD